LYTPITLLVFVYNILSDIVVGNVAVPTANVTASSLLNLIFC
jgi:hypothetical protein